MKRFAIAMIVLGVTMACGAASAQPHTEMGVEAKRHMKHFKDDIVPAEMKRFKESCGFEVAVDVDWDSFGNDADRIRGLSSNRGLAELNEAFHHLCKDQIGKDGVKAKIKRIAFRNIADRANKKMVLEKDVFKIECAYDLKALTEGTHSSATYRSYLEKQL
jgi:hypothetical protein